MCLLTEAQGSPQQLNRILKNLLQQFMRAYFSPTLLRLTTVTKKSCCSPSTFQLTVYSSTLFTKYMMPSCTRTSSSSGYDEYSSEFR